MTMGRTSSISGASGVKGMRMRMASRTSADVTVCRVLSNVETCAEEEGVSATLSQVSGCSNLLSSLTRL